MGQRLGRRLLPTKFLTGLVLIHNLAQALPWFAAIVVSAATASYGLAAESPFLLGVAGAVGSIAILTLLINFFVWYFEKRAHGWKHKADSWKEKLGGRELLHAESERMALALRLIRDLNLNRLEISDPLQRYDLTREWLTRHLTPAMSKISAGVGLGLLEWEGIGGKGEYRLEYDSGVPEIVRSVLPKQTNRDFTTCLAMLQQRNYHSLPIRDDIAQPVKDWLVAFPEVKFDLPAEAVFSTGVRIIADAWGGGGAPMPASA